MPVLPTLLPTGDSVVGSWTDNAGGVTNLWQKIEEGIAGAVDTNDFIKAPNDTNNTDYSFAVADTPATLGSIKTLNWQVRFALSGTPPASNKDTYGLAIRIVNGATILAAADSGGTFQTIVSTTTMSTSFTNSSVTAFTYVNTSATKATWDGAVCELRQTYSKAGGGDTHAVEVSAIQFTGTYNAILSLDVGSYAKTGVNPTLLFKHRVVPDVGSFTVSGVAASIHKIFTLSVDAGSYSEAGANPTLQVAHSLALNAGAYSLAGQDPGLAKGLTLSLAQGAYAIDGSLPGLSWAHQISCDVGGYAEAAIDPVLLHGRQLSAETGTYAQDGVDLPLRRGYGLALEVGTLAQTGVELTLSNTRTLSAAAGDYALSGTAAALLSDHLLSPAIGAYGSTGNDLVLRQGRTMGLESGNYAESGIDSALLRGYRLIAGQSNYDVIGSDLALLFNRILGPIAGDLAVAGITVTFSQGGGGISYRLTPDIGQFIQDGQVQSLRWNHQLTGELGELLLNGNDFAIRVDRVLATSLGIINLIGADPGLAYSGAGSFPISVEAGVFQLSGKNLRFLWLFPMPVGATTNTQPDGGVTHLNDPSAMSAVINPTGASEWRT